MSSIAKTSLVPFAYEHICKITAKYAEFVKSYVGNETRNDYETDLDISNMWFLANGIVSDTAATWMSRIGYVGAIVAGATNAECPIENPHAKICLNFDDIPVAAYHLDECGGINRINQFWNPRVDDYCGLRKMIIDYDYIVKTDTKLYVALLQGFMLCKIFETKTFEEAYKLYATCAIGFGDVTDNIEQWPIINLGHILTTERN